MALSSTPFMRRDGSITIRDATGTPISMTIQYEEGDFALDPVEEGLASTVLLLDRGVPYRRRKVDNQVIGFSFSCHATDLTDATEKTVYDMVRKKGAWAAAVSTWNTTDEVIHYTVVFTLDTSAIGGSSTTITLLKCRINAGFGEGDPAKFAIKGEAVITADTDFVVA